MPCVAEERNGDTVVVRGERAVSVRMRDVLRIGLCAASLAIAMAGPAHSDFVCNAKTKLVNVFLEPPSIRAYDPDIRVWRPGDMMVKPFEIVDTLPSGAPAVSHALAADKAWVWITFRHSMTGLVGNGYVHVSKLSSIPCDADPKEAAKYIELKQLGQEHGDYFDSGLNELDDLPLEGGRGAKRFETSMLSGAIRSSEVGFQCRQPGQDFDATTSGSANANGEIRSDTLELDPRIRACSKLLAVNPNYVEALIARGDIYHAFAKTPSRGMDSKSPKWAADLKRRKDAQQRAVADWTRASLLLPTGLPTVLEDRMAPTGAAGYEVK